MDSEEKEESGCAQQIGCVMMIAAVVMGLLIPVTFGISAIFGIPLAGIGINLMANGGRMARGEQGCRQSCLGCCIPGVLATAVAFTLAYTSILR